MPTEYRSSRKERVGTVISDRMDKTITVLVDWVKHDSVYNKIVRRHSKFKAHDAEKKAKMGDVVRIAETRPISKTKRWRLVEVVKKASEAPQPKEAQNDAVSFNSRPQD